MERQECVAFRGSDNDIPRLQPLCAKYTKSLAYTSLRERLPVILTNVVDDLMRNKSEMAKSGEQAATDLKTCIGKISKLKNELMTNKTFIKLCSKGEDVDEWNRYLDLQREVLPTVCWYEVTWLYAECYMYRRLREIFENSETLKEFDYFRYKKMGAFEKSLPDAEVLAEYALKAATSLSKDAEAEDFMILLKACLWGDRCRLSTSDSEHIADRIKSLEPFLLHDDSSLVYDLIRNMGSNLTIDFVADNVGYELFSDFCFCDFLCSSSLASKIRFHVKKIPWYVTQTTANDVKWLIHKMKDVGLTQLAARWDGYLSEGTWKIRDDGFWTLPFVYSEMKDKDNDLYNTLSESNLIIFKGDLNYRKLLREIYWDFSEEFDRVVEKFRPSNVLALRTVKSDIVCGLQKNKYGHLMTDMAWMRTGEYAVIQLSCRKEQKQ